MKKIALFESAIISEFQAHTTAAIAKSLYGRYNLDVFSNLGGFGESMYYSKGECNIMLLPDLSTYDGIIVFPDTMDRESLYPELVEKIQAEARCPVVSARWRDERFYNILTDDYNAIRLMMKHLVDVHGHKRIAFMKGPDEYQDARLRYKSYLDTMKEYGFPVERHMVFDGNYWKNMGPEAVDWFLGGPERPDAIVCANDYMAISVVEELIKRGINVPGDIAVTGYDDVEDCLFTDPRLASMAVSFEDMGNKVVEVLERLLSGEDVPKDSYVDVTPVYEGTCGCPAYPKTSALRESFQRVEYLTNAIMNGTFMNAENENALNRAELMQSLYRHSYYFSYEKVYLCMNQVSASTDDNSVESSEFDDEEHLLGGFYEEQSLYCIMDRTVDKVLFKDEHFKREKLLPDGYRRDGEMMMYFAIRYQNSTYGYIAILTKEPDELKRYFMVWVQSLASGLDKMQILEKNEAYLKYKEDSCRDELTGLLNRRGFNMILQRRRGMLYNGKKFFIMSLDMDGLKHINDHFGHLEGDAALCALADILRCFVSETVHAARTGGDEFTLAIFSEDMNTPDVIMDNIRAKISEYNKLTTKPYFLSASVGYARFNTAHGIAHCIDVADRNMYADKAEKKAGRGE